MKERRVSLIIGMLIWAILSTASASTDLRSVTRLAQQNLKKLGYYNDKIDGIIGRNTQSAVMQYQIEMDLPPTGLLDSKTAEYLSKPSVILATQNFAPFHFPGISKGEINGPIPQIVKMVCREVGMNCRIRLYDEWRQAQEDVKNGIADGMFVIAWNSNRAKWLYRSNTLIETEYGLFVRDDDGLRFNEVSEQPNMMEGYNVGVYGPSGTSNSLTRLKVALENKGVKFQINMEADDTPLFNKLSQSKGRYGVYTNRIVGESIVKGLGLSNIRYAGQHRSLSYYVGFSKQKVPLALVEKFNETYMRLIEQGDVRSVMANHGMRIPKNIVESPGVVVNKKVIDERFSLLNHNGIAVVEDATTCLTWEQSGSQKHCNWGEAVAYVAKLNEGKFAGFSDWRLPDIDELRSLVEKDRQKENNMYIQSLFDSLQQSCWSKEKKEMDIRFVDFYEGAESTKDQGDTNYVRAVRGERCVRKTL